MEGLGIVTAKSENGIGMIGMKMMKHGLNLDWYRGREVLVTGHTGFKGSWLCAILAMAGAKVWGLALDPPTDPNLYQLAHIGDSLRSCRMDVRDFSGLQSSLRTAQPEVVLHLAAQPIVRTSYEQPRETFETNIMGTVNLLEWVRKRGSVRSFLNVTTDKVYLNREWVYGYREDEQLDGFDPYSNSKSCSELVTHSYARSFFDRPGAPAVSTARAGNVIGGGDFARDRILPDSIRSAMTGQPIRVRNPLSTRPYQHVLEPLMAYLWLAQAQAEHPEKAGWYNVGPDEQSCVTTGELADLFVGCWGENASWEAVPEAGAVHEANFLKLDCSKIKAALGWRPVWDVQRAVQETVNWTRAWQRRDDLRREMEREVCQYLQDAESRWKDAVEQ